MALDRKLRMGMVGGGQGGFIGAVHRRAALMDGKIEIVAGCFSSDAEKSRAFGRELKLDPGRVYASYEEMAEKEAALPASERIDFASVVVPNHRHVPASRALLEAGFNVICDKPMATSLAEALELREVVRTSGKVFALTHNYTGYPMVKQARHMVQSGELGDLLRIVVEYPQGYATTALGDYGEAGISSWRADPKLAGVSNCMADIGTHAENLARYITGLKIEEICSDLRTLIPGRVLDDDGSNLVRWEKGVRGLLFASQVANGDENNLNIRVWGTKKSLEWRQEDPNELIIKQVNQPRVIMRRGNSYLCESARKFSRLPFAHPEGFIEAFANIYLAAAEAMEDELAGKYPRAEGYDFPTVEDGVIGNAFIETTVKSSQAGSVWTPFPGGPGAV